MNANKTSMYRAGLTDLEVGILAPRYDRLAEIVSGAKPVDEAERHFKSVTEGTSPALSALEVAWQKFRTYLNYESAKETESALGAYHPKTVAAFKQAASLGSVHAVKWFAERKAGKGRHWKNTLWNCPFHVQTVYGSSCRYADL